MEMICSPGGLCRCITMTALHYVCMFSSGAGSALAARRIAEDMNPDDQLTLLFADVNGEHPDNYRFLHEAHEWIGGTLVMLTNDGQTIWDTFRKTRFLGNTRIDNCSRVLKREPMRLWLERNCDPATTLVVMGFDWTESHRMARAKPLWKPWEAIAPLCEWPYIDKAEAMEVMRGAGVEPPWLTRMGFPHANCGGGCVKAGAKQWRKLLEVDPKEYQRWENEEEAMRRFLDKDVAILRDRRGGDTKPLTLARLRERLGVDPHYADEEDWGGCNCMTPIEEGHVAVEVEISTATRTIHRPHPKGK